MDAPIQSPSPASFPPAPVAGRSSVNGLLTIILAGAILVAVGGIAFYVGRQTAPAPQQALAGGFGAAGAGRNGGSGGFGNGAGGLNRIGGGLGGGVTIEGTVTAAATDSLTLRLQNGQTITIPLSSSTTYHRQAAAASGDVTSGATVLVRVTGRAQETAGTAPGSSSAPAPSAGSGFRFGPATDVTIAGN